MNTKGWIAAGAASALGLGVIASGALTVANAMPLYDTSMATNVPPISTAVAESKAFAGNGDVRFTVVPSTVMPTPTAATVLTPTTPTPTVASAPAVAPAPAPAPTVQQAPAPAPQPVAPAPADSPASIASPASEQSPNSP